MTTGAPLHLLSAVLLTAGGAAPAGERGSPPVAVYDAQALEAAHISTDVAQLPDGRLVVANMAGLLRFDGVRWQLVRHPGALGGMEHLALGPDGRIHTSFNGDIGYFADDARGQPQWHSVLAQVPADARSVGDVLDVSHDAVRAGTWITTFAHVLFVPDDGSGARVVGPVERLFFGGLVGADYCVQHAPQDTLSCVDTAGGFALRRMPGSELVRADPLRAVAPGDGDAKLVTVSGRLLRWRDGRVEPWSDAVRDAHPQLGVRTMIRLADGRYVIASDTQGPIVVGDDGAILDRYDEADGVPGRRRTHGLLQDRDGDLWLAQDRSLAKLALARGVTVYDETRGLPSANEARRWQGALFASSTVGLFRLDAASGPGGGRFEQVLPQLRDLRSLAVLDDATLLVAGTHVHAVMRDADGTLAARLVVATDLANVLEASRFVPGRVWVAHSGGLLRVDRDAAGALVPTDVPGVATALYRVVEQDADTLWVADRVDGVLRVDVAGASAPRRYGVGQGLPPGQVRIYSGPRRPWFTTTLGLRVYDAASDRFVVPAGLPPSLSADRLYSALEDVDGNLWVRGGAIVNDVFWREGDAWRADGTLLQAVEPNPTIFSFVREGPIVWAVRATGLLRFDLAARTPLGAVPPVLLTGVHDLRAKADLPIAAAAAVGPDVRDLRFDFALPVLHRPDATRYRSRLAGYDTAWSDWSARGAASRVYTNLPDGEFTLAVEAQDAVGRVAALPVHALRIAPPWWRTPAARVAYVIAAVLALWLAAHWGARRRQHRMLARQRELEDTVAARTRELAQSNARLAEQAERLTEVDRLKTRFFVNVGHEFRTPLTLVLGPIDDLLRDPRVHLGEHARELLEMANRNARRVLNLIVELLDVNRFEHGHMRLARVATDLRVLAERVLAEHAPLLDRHGHRAAFDAAPGGAWLADVDPAQIERCLGNLIGNAAKYMARGGLVTLRLERRGDTIELALSDQGRGISAAALPHVFDRFFQAEGNDCASGYGIGLALVREIVEAHGGRVGVESTPGVGSRFVLALPASAAAAAGTAPVDDTPVVPDAVQGVLPRAADATGRRPLVLVVDDHDDLRARARGLLADRFDVIEAADGPGAWNLLRDRLPDVIVCDVMMPGFDGIELTRRVRADPDTATIALLLLTAKAGGDHATAGLRAGADDYLAKPFDASELLARIDALLARAQRLRLRLAREALTAPAPPAAESADERWRRRLDQLVDAHLDDAAFGVEELAAAMHADRSQLFRRCKELLGTSPSEHLRDARLKRAHRLLEDGAGSVSEVAYAVGFDTLSSFTRAFKARYAVPPSRVERRKAG